VHDDSVLCGRETSEIKPHLFLTETRSNRRRGSRCYLGLSCFGHNSITIKTSTCGGLPYALVWLVDTSRTQTTRVRSKWQNPFLGCEWNRDKMRRGRPTRPCQACSRLSRRILRQVSHERALTLHSLRAATWFLSQCRLVHCSDKNKKRVSSFVVSDFYCSLWARLPWGEGARLKRVLVTKRVLFVWLLVREGGNSVLVALFGCTWLPAMVTFFIEVARLSNSVH
jgi:hypothetical protein